MSGPCSAESEEQVLATALALAKCGKIDVLRAGVWKPRSRPYAFEGAGEQALAWLKTVSIETKIPVITEVANAQHVEKALKSGIDMLWIGARTTVNPFSVQEIADALKGVDIPVLVKNPINPDLQLWIGAIERIKAATNGEVGAVHRGFSSGTKSRYRNNPFWEIPIELKRQFSDLKILCDPSHICGNRELIHSVAQKALDLNFDGLMIESHFNPSEALSDAQQQLLPSELELLLNSLEIRTEHSVNPFFQSQLDMLRAEIDAIDEQMIDILFKRFQIIEKIGEYKQENNVTILQLERWKEILNTRSEWAENSKLNTDFIKKILETIHTESIRIQNGVMSKRKAD
ncbi:MAG: chorismate mutase [Flavobacteriales bacterium]